MGSLSAWAAYGGRLPTRPGQHGGVLDDHAVVEDGGSRRARELAILVEARRLPDDVVCLPLARRPRGVDERRALAVECARLPVGIGHAVVRVEDLHLVPAHQEDPAVAAVLVLAHGRRGRHELDVELAVAEALPGLDPPGALRDLEVALLDLPGRGPAVLLGLPAREVLAVEEHDRIRGGLAGLIRGAGGAGIHHRRKRPRAVVDRPFLRSLGASAGRGQDEGRGRGQCESKICAHKVHASLKWLLISPRRFAGESLPFGDAVTRRFNGPNRRTPLI